jgi:hypothetical protein
MTGLFIDISTPIFCTDLKKQAFENAPDRVFMVENRFLTDMGSVSSELLFMPHRESLGIIAQKLCERYGFTIPTEIL